MNKDENSSHITSDENKSALTDPERPATLLTDSEKSTTSLTDLMHAGMGIPSPFMKEIFLLRQGIVGTRYLGGSDALVEDLQPGSRISFVAEPDNKYDEYAVMALDSQGRKLGYIPRHENRIIGALLKAGKSIYGIMPDEQQENRAVAPGSEKTPYVLWVDLYMREFLLPDDISQIPRQGYQGSYAVVDFALSEEQERRISRIYAIKVINGEERDNFYRVINGEKPGEYTDAIASFQKFVGHLPIVSHDIMDEILPQLEDAYGVELGMPFSNHVIDTKQMAANHLPFIRDKSLNNLAEELGIEVHWETQEEAQCRIVWKLYCRMERSELERKEKENSSVDVDERADAGTVEEASERAQVRIVEDATEQAGRNRLDESIEVYPLSSMTRQVLRANGIATLRELTRYTEDDINYMDYVVDEDFREIMAALEREGAHPRPEDQNGFLYGYPDSMQRLAKEKGPLWEVQLLFEGIITWYRWLDPVRRLYLPVWCAGELAKPLFEKEDLMQWISGQLDILKDILEEIDEIVNYNLTLAIDEAKEQGDAQALMDCVERLLRIYKRALLWRQSFSQIDTREVYKNLMEEFFFEVSITAFQSFDSLYKKSCEGLSLVQNYLEGRLSVKKLNLDLTVEADINREGIEEILHALREA